MAIYQFLTHVIPKQGVLNRYNHVPERLEINHEAWRAFWESWDGKSENETDFEDAITIDWWADVEIDTQKLADEIDAFMPRAGWGSPDSTHWKDERNGVDHDLSFDVNEKTGRIDDFRFRADLTETSLLFVQKMISICANNGWLLMDEKGTLIEPRIENYVELLKDSDAIRFLTDPKNFLSSLEKKN